MNNYPSYVEINNKRYKINTDFRYAIECDRIALDNSIGELERALAIIYTLFGEEGLNSEDDYEKLLMYARKFLSCGKEIKESNEKSDMDFYEDYDYIETSFRSDYGIKLEKEKMHWWKFYKLVNGLSNSELGNCCILNRVRNLRNYNTKDIKDSKEKKKIEEAQKEVELKCNKNNITKKEKESATRILEEIRKEVNK